MRLLMLFLFVALVSACDNTSPKEGPTKETLEGKWIMEAAARDGKLTETLKGSFFNFISPDKLINNINRKEEVYTYTLTDDIIEQRGKLDVDYQIMRFRNDTLVLGTRIRDYEFRFLLLRDTSGIEDGVPIEL